MIDHDKLRAAIVWGQHEMNGTDSESHLVTLVMAAKSILPKKTASERLRESVDAFRANGCKEFYDLANMARALADFADEQLEKKA